MNTHVIEYRTSTGRFDAVALNSESIDDYIRGICLCGYVLIATYKL